MPFILCYVLGMLQGFIFNVLMSKDSVGGSIIYLVALSILYNIDSSVNGIFVDLFRLLPAAFFFQLFIIKFSNKPLSNNSQRPFAP